MSKKIYIENIEAYGWDFPCISASSLYNRIKKYFSVNNYLIVTDPLLSDYIILNTCGVSESFIPWYISKISDYKKQSSQTPKVIVFWCVAGVSPELKKVVDINIPLKKEFLLDWIFEHQIAFEDVDYFDAAIEMWKMEGFSKQAIKKYYLDIGRWCVHNCSYCGIKKGIWFIKSKKLEDILEEIKKALENNYSVIHLITDDIGSYGYDIESNFGELFNAICEISENFKIEISYCEPSEFMKYFELIKDRLHRVDSLTYPIQSYHDRILKMMRRKYTVEEFQQSVKEIRKYAPNIYLINNVIYGYPTESYTEFLENIKSIELFDENAFCFYNEISGKKEYKEEDKVPIEEKLRRKKIIGKLHEKYWKKICF